MIAHRIYRRDPKTVANRAIRGTASPLHHDIVLPAKIHDVPDDEKITGEPELLNESELFLELPFDRATNRRVTLLRSEKSDRSQERIHAVPVRDGKLGKFVADIFQGKCEAFRKTPRVFNRLRAVTEKSAHLRVTL
jgi:hypothetical protein